MYILLDIYYIHIIYLSYVSYTHVYSISINYILIIFSDII